jgi:hypothetical protein
MRKSCPIAVSAPAAATIKIGELKVRLQRSSASKAM